MANLETLLADTRYWVDQGSDPSAPSAGQPVTYTKSGQLYLRNSSGIVGPLLDETAHDALDHTGLTGVGGGGGGASGGSITLVRTTSDVNNNTTSLTDATGLSFAVANGSVYAFRFFVRFATASTATGILLSINGPTASYSMWQQSIPEGALVVSHSARNTYNAGAGDATANANIGAGAVAVIDGLIAPTANGTLIVRFASEVGSSQVTILPGSVGVLYTVS